MLGHSCRSLVFAAAAVVALPQAAHAQAAGELSAADRAAVFKAAGAVQRHGQWVACVDDPHGGAAEIGETRDLDGDGRLEVVVVGHGSFCYGHAETGYSLLSKQVDGGWRLMDANDGVPEFLQTHGKDGWPDISVGGPGFCFPVMRWNDTTYAFNRNEYEGKHCAP